MSYLTQFPSVLLLFVYTCIIGFFSSKDIFNIINSISLTHTHLTVDSVKSAKKTNPRSVRAYYNCLTLELDLLEAL